jgi:hypothetical protein
MLSVILPTYNEAGSLGPLIGRLQRLRRLLPGGGLEVIVVDDASPDGTARVAELQSRKYGNVRLTRRPKRMGLASAILRGAEAAQGDILAVMDSDLQHPPELLPAAARRILDGADLVVMSRFAARGGVAHWSKLRALLSRSATAVTHLLLPETRPLSDPLSGFFLLRPELLRGQSFRCLGYKLLLEILMHGGCRRIEELPFSFRPRAAGRSKMSLGDGLNCLRLLLFLRHKTAGRSDSPLEPNRSPRTGRQRPAGLLKSGAPSLVLSPELVLCLKPPGVRQREFPTGTLCKGLRMVFRGCDLSEEGVGFGVPVVKRGLRTLFPGGLTISEKGNGAGREVTAEFNLNLVERVSRQSGRSLRSRLLYAVKNSLAWMHRRCPALRPALTGLSNALRLLLRLQTVFEPAPPADEAGTVRVTFSLAAGKGGVRVAVDAAGLRPRGLTELVLMNEQGARAFHLYRDSGGLTLRGNRIGTWDPVTAAEASLLSPAHGLAFSLRQVEGARLYRGRELVDSRLAWSGFGYVLPPGKGSFRYEIAIGMSP